MRRILLTVVTVVLLYAIAVGAGPVASHPAASSSGAAGQSSSAPREKQPQIQVFLGTISRTGNQFVFSDEVNKSSYQLDDQETASRFDGKKVKVTGMLDATNNIIRVQSIEATA